MTAQLGSSEDSLPECRLLSSYAYLYVTEKQQASALAFSSKGIHPINESSILMT